MTSMDPGLESSYRRILRMLPAGYRRRRGGEILQVLMETAEPGRRRPRMAEVRALARLALVVRWRGLLSSRPEVRRDATAVLAVAAPLLLLAPAAMALTNGVLISFSWPFVSSVPGWMLWILTAAMVSAGWVTPARWGAVAATAAYVGGIAAQAADHNFLTAGRDAGWLVLQLIALCALWSESVTPQALRRPSRHLLALAAAAGGSGYAMLSWYSVRFGFEFDVRWVHFFVGWIAGLAVLAAMSVRRIGRSLLPLAGAAGAGLVAGQWSVGSLGNYGDEIQPWGAPSIGGYLPLIVLPLAAFVVLRLLVAVIEAVVDRSPRHRVLTAD